MNTLRVLRAIYDNPANRDNRISPFLRMLGWQTYKRIRGRSIDLPVFGGSVKLRCYPDSSSCSSVIYANGGLSDFHEMSFMKHYLREGDHFLDIGANSGIYTLLASSLVGQSGKVLAIEAAPETTLRMREQIQLNQLEEQVTLFEGAVSNKSGMLEFTTGRDSTNQISTSGDDKTVSVRCEPLDSIIEPGQKFAMAKIDVEGAEPMVLEGAESMLASGNPPVIILEVNGRLHNFGYTEEQLEQILKSHGYRLALYDSDKRRFRYGSRLWEESQNLFAISDKHIDEILAKLRTYYCASRTRSNRS